ncbi:MAG: YraN family protein [Kiritimatiellia bacterium]
MAWLIKSFKPGSVTGNWGEACAVAYLKKAHCKIIGQNVRPKPRLEIDIIARDPKGVYLFVEVKTRKVETEWLGRPLDAINLQKRLRMRRAAICWLVMKELYYNDPLYRFDAIEVIGTPEELKPEIRWIQGIDMSKTYRRGAYL